MNREAIRVQNKLAAVWQDFKGNMKRMRHESDVRPGSSEDIFKFREVACSDEIKVEVDPVVFKFPERAEKAICSLYIVVKGWITFKSPIETDAKWRARSFGTSVGYFRIKPNHLLHIYGVHYDCDENSFGHPVFHAQFKSQLDLLEEIRERFRERSSACDKVKNILRNVRTPSAEMDIFSVFIQICGDHLIYEGSSTDEKAAFSQMLKSCGFFTGAAERISHLHQPSRPYCYRSGRWYPPV